jgi:hypothetical protein
MGEISDDAVMPITQHSWPKTYAAWGKDGIDRINALMQPAAEVVASSPGCDRLDVLALSEDRSSAPNSVVFYADCANGNRFYITEDDIVNKRKVVSQNSKSTWLSDQQMFEISMEAVKGRLMFPCHFSEATVQRAVVGRTVVTLAFRHADENGANAIRVAKCYFDGVSLKEVEFMPL